MYVPDQRLEPPEDFQFTVTCSSCGRCVNGNTDAETFYKIDGDILCENCAIEVYAKNNFKISKNSGVCQGCGRTKQLYEFDNGEFCADCVWDIDCFAVDELQLDLDEYADSLGDYYG